MQDMNSFDFQGTLKALGLTQVEVATLLSVDARTVRRWAESPATITASAKEALIAWRLLNQHGLPWMPGSVNLVDGMISDQLALERAHAIDLANLIDRVKKRGGPAAPWKVDLARGRATLESMVVSFYKTANGSFSPQTYTRTDIPNDLERDRALIEDAYVCIANAIAVSRKQT